MRVGERLRQRVALAAEQAIESVAEGEQQCGERQSAAERDDERVRDEALGRVLAARAERARERRGHAAAHGAGGEHLHQHHQRKDERQAGERRGAQAPDVVGVGDRHRGLKERERRPGRGEARERRDDGVVEKALRAGGAHAPSLT